MEAINYLYGALGLAYIVPFLFVLTIVVFFHELGHFYAARRCGVRVEVFSVGFGRAIASWHDKHGTEWKIGWLPLGGYVKFFGDENEASAPDAEKLKELPDDARGDTLFFKPFGSAHCRCRRPGRQFHSRHYHFCVALYAARPAHHRSGYWDCC